jgi:hypothetical protein
MTVTPRSPKASARAHRIVLVRISHFIRRLSRIFRSKDVCKDRETHSLVFSKEEDLTHNERIPGTLGHQASLRPGV